MIIVGSHVCSDPNKTVLCIGDSEFANQNQIKTVDMGTSTWHSSSCQWHSRIRKVDPGFRMRIVLCVADSCVSLAV
jgi:hypothetical protein